MLDFSLEEECLFNSDDDDIPFLAAVATYMRRHLPRNKGFYQNILLAYKLTIGEFKSHFRMTRGTFEALCREVQATGSVPKFLNQEPGHDRLSIRRKEEEATELTEGVAAIFPCRRYGRERPGTGKPLRNP